MERAVEIFAEVRNANQDLLEKNEQEAELKLVKEQILDIGDKFDALLVEIKQSKVLKKKRPVEEEEDLKSEYENDEARRKIKLEILGEIMRDARNLDLQERSKLRDNMNAASSLKYSREMRDHFERKALQDQEFLNQPSPKSNLD